MPSCHQAAVGRRELRVVKTPIFARILSGLFPFGRSPQRSRLLPSILRGSRRGSSHSSPHLVSAATRPLPLPPASPHRKRVRAFASVGLLPCPAQVLRRSYTSSDKVSILAFMAFNLVSTTFSTVWHAANGL